MKALRLTVALGLCLLASSAWSMGRPLPKPAAPATKPKSSGTVFKLGSGCGNYEGGEDQLVADADAACASGRAERISGWKVTQTADTTIPGSCETVNGVMECSSDYEVTYYYVEATFRCR